MKTYLEVTAVGAGLMGSVYTGLISPYTAGKMAIGYGIGNLLGKLAQDRIQEEYGENRAWFVNKSITLGSAVLFTKIEKIFAFASPIFTLTSAFSQVRALRQNLTMLIFLGTFALAGIAQQGSVRSLSAQQCCSVLTMSICGMLGLAFTITQIYHEFISQPAMQNATSNYPPTNTESDEDYAKYLSEMVGEEVIIVKG